MSADHELLELAAKAQGLYVKYQVEDHDGNLVGLKVKPYRQAGRNTSVMWNPLTDDGDALRLAVALTMMIDYITKPATAYKLGNVVAVSRANSFYEPGFSAEATRRAIVRAAAEVGRAML